MARPRQPPSTVTHGARLGGVAGSQRDRRPDSIVSRCCASLNPIWLSAWYCSLVMGVGEMREHLPRWFDSFPNRPQAIRRLRGPAQPGPPRAVPPHADGSIVVHHFGPDMSETGGIEAVIRLLVSRSVGGDVVRAHATRSWRGHGVTARQTVAAAVALLRLSRASVVHVHLSERGSFVREGGFLLAARLKRMPIVVTNHGAEYVEFAAEHKRLVRAVLGGADVVLSLSPAALETSRSLAPNAMHALVPNPAPAHALSSAAGAAEEVALFAGEVGTRKGVDVLLRAWPLVLEHRPQARLIVVGRPSDVFVGDVPGVILRGEVSPIVVAALMRDARVVVLPSRHEAMPMVLTEALAAGRPFVGTRIAGVVELAHGVQALIQPGDHLALAAEISELLADPDLATKRGELGRQFYLSTRSVEAVTPRLREAYLYALRRRVPT